MTMMKAHEDQAQQPEDEVSHGDSSSHTDIDLMEDDNEDNFGIELANNHANDDQLMSLISVVNQKHQNRLLEDYPELKNERSCIVTILQVLIVIGAIVGVVLMLTDPPYYGLEVFFRYPHLECPPTYMMDPNSNENKYYLLAQDRVYNESKFLQEYRQGRYDHWDTTFDDFKTQMYAWKAKHFAPNLNNGDAIYESASGLGLNLVATLEIVEEVKNVTNLHVYGNDFVFESTYTSNRLMDMGILPAHGKKGQICQGDSLDLYWVPSDSFDLVFTGYVPPLQNPLEFDLEEDDLWDKYDVICQEKNQHQKDLVQEMTELQEAHYGRWVGEMIRIAKPGKAIVVEQVSQSVCSFWDDWGGVDTDFWYRASEEYGWDIDPSTIHMEEDKFSEEERYHVYFRKNPKN